jgi:hypothetical protein
MSVSNWTPHQTLCLSLLLHTIPRNMKPEPTNEFSHIPKFNLPTPVETSKKKRSYTQVETIQTSHRKKLDLARQAIHQPKHENVTDPALKEKLQFKKTESNKKQQPILHRFSVEDAAKKTVSEKQRLEQRRAKNLNKLRSIEGDDFLK